MNLVHVVIYLSEEHDQLVEEICERHDESLHVLENENSWAAMHDIVHYQLEGLCPLVREPSLQSGKAEGLAGKAKCFHSVSN